MLLDRIGKQDDSAKFTNWLTGLQLVESQRNGSFHDIYSNQYAFVTNTPLSLASRSGIRFGVDRHPWMSPVGHTPATELNDLEIDSVYLTNPRQVDEFPFPDTLRLPPEPKHRDAFERITASRNDQALSLVYVRYFISTAVTGASKAVVPNAQIAYAYRPSAGSQLMMILGAVN
jgi:hypothetical protein